jgi:hypothetical protein
VGAPAVFVPYVLLTRGRAGWAALFVVALVGLVGVVLGLVGADFAKYGKISEF